MRIIFFGEDSFSATVLYDLITNGYKILSVYCPLYDNIIHARLHKVCNDNSISFKRVKDINAALVEAEIRNLNPDIICVCHFEKIIKKNIIDIPKYGCINLHPSLLPYYRGLSPQHWPIINGNYETGITVHFINESIDTGDIIVQKKIQIHKDEYVSDLQKRMVKIYGPTMIEAICNLQKEKFFFIQGHLKGSYYGKLKVSDCIIDLNSSFYNALNLIRGVSYPYFGARIENIIIWRAKIADNNVFSEFSSLPNGFISNKSLGNFIKFSDGLIEVEKFNII